jgi:hypothetical protein
MKYLVANRIGSEVLYTVYNSRGHAMLITRSFKWAEIIARSFERNPATLQIVVEESRVKKPKRV